MRSRVVDVDLVQATGGRTASLTAWGIYADFLNYVLRGNEASYIFTDNISFETLKKIFFKLSKSILGFYIKNINKSELKYFIYLKLDSILRIFIN